MNNNIAPSFGELLGNEQLAVAQRSINLPEVQEMIKRLAAYNLGVFMPHMHDDEGSFQVLPEGFLQVENDLQVSFMPETNLPGTDTDVYIPVGWGWSEANQRVQAGTVCRMERINGSWQHIRTGSTH